MKNKQSGPLMSTNGPSLTHLFRAESTPRSGAYRHHVREAARYVFCIYHGIPVSAIRETAGQLVVHSNSDHTESSPHGMLEYIEMLLSGAVAVQIIFGGENQEMVDAISEAERVYNLRSGFSMMNDGQFEGLVQKASRNAAMHMADPKVRAAIASATRTLARHRTRLGTEDLENLRTLVRRALS